MALTFVVRNAIVWSLTIFSMSLIEVRVWFIGRQIWGSCCIPFLWEWITVETVYWMENILVVMMVANKFKNRSAVSDLPKCDGKINIVWATVVIWFEDDRSFLLSLDWKISTEVFRPLAWGGGVHGPQGPQCGWNGSELKSPATFLGSWIWLLCMIYMGGGLVYFGRCEAVEVCPYVSRVPIAE